MKHCANPKCGRALAQRKNERDSNWARRVTCGEGCAIMLRRSKNCGNVAVIPRLSHGAEYAAGYRNFGGGR